MIGTDLAVTAAGLHNPYWDTVKTRVDDSPLWGGGVVIDQFASYRSADGRLDVDRWAREGCFHRKFFTNRYAWTITEPASVAFVAAHAGPGIVDPMAGTGYWAALLGQLGVDVLASDLNPPSPHGQANHYHQQTDCHVPVLEMDAVDAVRVHHDRTLLLSWPPLSEPIGNLTLQHYTGDRVIYIGESEGGCCGTDAMFETLAGNWTEVACHWPVQWAGIHDHITVYDRKAPKENNGPA